MYCPDTMYVYTHFAKNDFFSLIHTHIIITQYESYYDHTFHPTHNSLTWTLDYAKTSDMDDVSGHWHVEALDDSSSKSRVWYACDIRLKGNVPRPILNYLSKAALQTATAWVKRHAEMHPNESKVAKDYGYDVSSSGSTTTKQSAEATVPRRGGFWRLATNQRGGWMCPSNNNRD